MPTRTRCWFTLKNSSCSRAGRCSAASFDVIPIDAPNDPPSGPLGGSLGASIGITSKLAAEQRPALEQLLFFNVNQHRVRVGIQQSIDTYGVPEIYEEDGGLRVRVGDIAGVQTLFAISDAGRPVGVAVFVRSAHERFAVLHLGVDPRLSLTADQSTRVLLKLMHEIRSTARRTRGVDCIELVYKVRHAVRLHG